MEIINILLNLYWFLLLLHLLNLNLDAFIIINNQHGIVKLFLSVQWPF